MGLLALDWLIDVQTTDDGTVRADRQPRVLATRGPASQVRPAADRGDLGDPRRRGCVRADADRATCARSRLRTDGSSVTMTSAWRSPTRSRGGCYDGLEPLGVNPQPGGRVDAHVAHRAGACSCGPSPCSTTAGRARAAWRTPADRNLRTTPMDAHAAGLFVRHPDNPLIRVEQLPTRRAPSSTRAPRGSTARPCSSCAWRTCAGSRISRSRAAGTGSRGWQFAPSRCSRHSRTSTRKRSGAGGSPPDLAPGTERVGDRLHGLQPPRAARLAGDDRTSAMSGGSARSCRPRTRTRRSSRAGSMVAGR